MSVSSNSFVKYTTIRSNNQLQSKFFSQPFALAWHASSNNKSISAIACNYIENNDSSSDGRLIGTILNICYCCIINKFVTTTTYYTNKGSIVVINTFSDDNSASLNSIEFNSIVNSSECKYSLNKNILDNCRLSNSIKKAKRKGNNYKNFLSRIVCYQENK